MLSRGWGFSVGGWLILHALATVFVQQCSRQAMAQSLSRCLRCRWAACCRRFALRQRSNSRWQSGSRQNWNWSWGRRAWNFRPHPLRKHFRQPSRLLLVEPPLLVVRCACPMGGFNRLRFAVVVA
jgi:hypothetical protein